MKRSKIGLFEQKWLDDGSACFKGILKQVMPRFLNPVALHVWPAPFPFLKKTSMKTEILHSPTGNGGGLRKSTQCVFGFNQHRKTGVVRLVGNVAHKPLYRNPVVPVVVWKEKSVLDRFRERSSDGHFCSGPSEPVEPPNQKAPQKGQPAKKNS